MSQVYQKQEKFQAFLTKQCFFLSVFQLKVKCVIKTKIITNYHMYIVSQLYSIPCTNWSKHRLFQSHLAIKSFVTKSQSFKHKYSIYKFTRTFIFTQSVSTQLCYSVHQISAAVTYCILIVLLIVFYMFIYLIPLLISFQRCLILLFYEFFILFFCKLNYGQL